MKHSGSPKVVSPPAPLLRRRSIAATTWPRLLLAAAGLALVCAIASPVARAQATLELQTRSLAASCAQCHGTDGRVPPGSAMGGLAGLPAPYMIEQMKAFRDGVRPGTVMPQLAKGFDDAQVERLARYFSAIAPTTAAHETP